MAPHQADADLVCINCDYDLRALNAHGECPECGTPIRDSIYSQGNKKLFQYENRLLAREKNYRVNRSNALALAALFLFGLVAFGVASTVTSSVNHIGGYQIILSACMVPFWLAISFANHARLRHVESIKNARAGREKPRHDSR